MRSHRPDEGRNLQLDRILRIIRDLDRLDGVDVYELAERHGTTVRTIRRDLDAIDGAGLPLDGELRDGRKHWRVAVRDKLQDVAALLDASHYLALRVAMGQGGAVGQRSGLFAMLEDLAAKIEKAIGPAERGRLAAIDRCFTSWDKHAYRSAAKEFFWPLLTAIEEGRICVATYRAARRDARARSFEVLPLRLFVHDHAVYLLCEFRKHREVGTLNLQRLRGLKVTDRRARPPRGFDPAAWESAAFGIFPGGKPTTYVLQFAAEVAPYIRERVWHPSQEVRELPRGRVELTFTCGESFEVTNWVASWRDWVEAVEPEGLRRQLRELGRWLCDAYARRRVRAPEKMARRGSPLQRGDTTA
jgi:predicted DNA-binding transcriptional regulator YafY